MIMSNQQLQKNETSAVPKTVKGWLSGDYFKQQVALCLPKHLTADRFVRVALSALTRIPKLGQCTPESVIKCMMTCSELGLEPDGRRAHLIPFGKECTLIIDYKGLVELAKRSGDVSNIHAQIVCERDVFDYNTGEVTHKIDFKNDRGTMYAVYTVIKFKDGGQHTEIMTKKDVDRIRARSRAKDSGPWVTDYDEMAKKTVFRRASKWVVLSPEIQDALDKDADPLPSVSTAALVSEAPLELQEPEAQAAEPETIDIPAAAEPDTRPMPETKAEAYKQGHEGGTASTSHKSELAKVILDAGHTFSDFQQWARESGNIEDADSLTGFDDVHEVIARRLVRARIGMIKGIAAAKGAIPV